MLIRSHKQVLGMLLVTTNSCGGRVGLIEDILRETTDIKE